MITHTATYHPIHWVNTVLHPVILKAFTSDALCGTFTHWPGQTIPLLTALGQRSYFHNTETIFTHYF